MALPTINTPTYELEIPSTDEKIKYRPFLVKEEKILLLAMESGKQTDVINAIKQIVTACTFGKLKIGTMPMFDVEYLFLNIRAKSVGEVSKLRVLCKDDGKTYANVSVDLNDIEVQVTFQNKKGNEKYSIPSKINTSIIKASSEEIFSLDLDGSLIYDINEFSTVGIGIKTSQKMDLVKVSSLNKFKIVH